MSCVVQLDDFRPHLCIQGNTSIHVVPVLLIEKLISGVLTHSDIEGFDDLLPTILSEWLTTFN